MLAVENTLGLAGASARSLLPLESGEFMHSREFLRRYERMPQVKNAELIAEVLHLGSPVSVRGSKPNALIHGWLVAEARLECSCLEEDGYRPQLPDAQGVVHNRVFADLCLPVAPLLAGDDSKGREALAEQEPADTGVSSWADPGSFLFASSS